MKIVALGLYYQCYSDSLLGVHTPILLTWKYIKVNVTGRGVWHSGIWKALWKISHFLSFLHPFSAGSEIKLGLRENIPNFGVIGCMYWHQLQNISSCWLFLLACFTLNSLLLFLRLGSLFPKLALWGGQSKIPGSSLSAHRLLLCSPTWVIAMCLSVDPNLILHCSFFQSCIPWCLWP